MVCLTLAHAARTLDGVASARRWKTIEYGGIHHEDLEDTESYGQRHKSRRNPQHCISPPDGRIRHSGIRHGYLEHNRITLLTIMV